MFRSRLLSVLVAMLIALTAAPAFAGPAETAYLQKLTNTWSGKGKLTGAETGAIACKIVIKGGAQRASYQGRCAIPDMAQQAFNGSIVYNDKLQRFESRSAGGTVVGFKRGTSLVFTTKNTSLAGTAYSTMTISPIKLVVDFALVDNKTGEKTTARITFTR